MSPDQDTPDCSPSLRASAAVRSPDGPARTLAYGVAIVAAVYAFLVSVKLMGTGCEMFGAGFAERLISTTSNPFLGLFIGILSTSIVQSSSLTSSMVVGFVSSGLLTVTNAVPIIMGANIGTTVTCALVSLGHVGRKEDFRRAFSAASVHDFFNIITVVILFPLEIATGYLSRTATVISRFLAGGEGVSFANPVKAAVDPVVQAAVRGIRTLGGTHAALIVAVLGFTLLVVSLLLLVKLTKAVALGRAEVVIDRILGRGGLAGIVVGAILTGIIQSSSVVTSLLVTLAGAGIVTLEQIFPVTLGANIGTTVTALLASLAGDARGLTIAIVHTLFNVTGVLIVYPYPRFRRIPLFLARKLADAAVRSKKNLVFFLVGLFYAVPGLFILIDKLAK
jgi:sodium-dependent phosphate cotransporter